jgi:hypothetical protein
MNMNAYMDCLKNTALKNPIAQSINEALDKLGEISIVGLTDTAIAALTAMKDNLLEQAAAAKDWVVGLKDSLPLLKASDLMSNKMKIMKGITPSINGGDLIKGITQGLDDIAENALAFATGLKNTVSDAISGGISAIEGAIGGLTDSVTGFASDLKSGLDGVTESIGGAITDLKDYAFAKFSALPQPPSLSELMSKILPDVCQAPHPEEIKIEEDIAREVVDKKYDAAIEPSTPIPTDVFDAKPVETAKNEEDIPAPIVNNKTVDEIKDSVFEQLYSTFDRKTELRRELQELLLEADVVSRRLYPDYDATWAGLKAGDLASKNKFDKIAAHLRTIDPYVTMQIKSDELEKCDSEITRLHDLMLEWSLNNYENVPNGPPW